VSDDLAARRAAIDALDREIVRLVSERATHARAIGGLKGDGPIYRPEREAQVLERVRAANPGPLADEALARIYVEIMSACRALEQPLAVSYLGPAGTFSEMALRKQFGGGVESRPCASIDEVFRQAETGGVHYAVVPVENSTEGAVGRTLDLLLATSLCIVGEVVLRVHQNFMTRCAAPQDVRVVYSHSQSLAQCQGWLARAVPHAAREAVASNAEAARRAAAEEGAAALGPALAAERYGLAILAANVEDEPNNMTRFLVLGVESPGASGRDVTSLVMSAPNRPGAVHALLSPIARHGVSMSRIESRPARMGTWEYMFYVDLVGHRDDASIAAALAELRPLAPFLKVLGSYPHATVD
jgi:chorismate mutase/prephenate dehydratase